MLVQRRLVVAASLLHGRRRIGLGRVVLGLGSGLLAAALLVLGLGDLVQGHVRVVGAVEVGVRVVDVATVSEGDDTPASETGQLLLLVPDVGGGGVLAHAQAGQVLVAAAGEVGRGAQ